MNETLIRSGHPDDIATMFENLRADAARGKALAKLLKSANLIADRARQDQFSAIVRAELRHAAEVVAACAAASTGQYVGEFEYRE